MFSLRFNRVVRFTVLLAVAASLSGCGLFRASSTSKPNFDPPPESPHRPVDHAVKTMLLEVTTDASGAVVKVAFKKSSGSDAIDGYVADSLRSDWPPKPSTVSLVELTYSAAREKRFSDPKILSTSPAP